MTKFVNSLKQALLKKQAALHPEAKSTEDTVPVVKPPVTRSKKLTKKHTARGR